MDGILSYYTNTLAHHLFVCLSPCGDRYVFGCPHTHTVMYKAGSEPGLRTHAVCLDSYWDRDERVNRTGARLAHWLWSEITYFHLTGQFFVGDFMQVWLWKDSFESTFHFTVSYVTVLTWPVNRIGKAVWIWIHIIVPGGIVLELYFLKMFLDFYMMDTWCRWFVLKNSLQWIILEIWINWVAGTALRMH